MIILLNFSVSELEEEMFHRGSILLNSFPHLRFEKKKQTTKTNQVSWAFLGHSIKPICSIKGCGRIGKCETPILVSGYKYLSVCLSEVYFLFLKILFFPAISEEE